MTMHNNIDALIRRTRRLLVEQCSQYEQSHVRRSSHLILYKSIEDEDIPDGLTCEEEQEFTLALYSQQPAVAAQLALIAEEDALYGEQGGVRLWLPEQETEEEETRRPSVGLIGPDDDEE